MSSKIINGKELWYFTCRPNNKSKPHIDSNKRDTFCTDLSGDAHHRGLRITLNNTFTASGMCAPVFACVYGLTASEMPGDEIVYRPIKGLVAGSGQTGNMQEGYVVFVRGKYETLEEFQAKEKKKNSPVVARTTLQSTPKKMSKEARVAKLYRDLIYYPLIKHIRTAYYGMDQEGAIPDNLTAISWMDSCYGQLKVITNEDLLKIEKDLKIICNKHNAGRTGTEQSADVGPSFKNLRIALKNMPPLLKSNSPILKRITKLLEKLENRDNPESTQIVILSNAKKQAIIQGMSKLPYAMNKAFTPENIKAGFYDTGQIDKKHGSIPCIKTIISTYRGYIDREHYLNKGTSIIKTFYNEMFLNGLISEESFDKHSVEMDKNSKGEEVSRHHGISRENMQRAKVLSAPTQREERAQLIRDNKLAELDHLKKILIQERKRYETNLECENRICELMHQINNIGNVSQLDKSIERKQFSTQNN